MIQIKSCTHDPFYEQNIHPLIIMKGLTLPNEQAATGRVVHPLRCNHEPRYSVDRHCKHLQKKSFHQKTLLHLHGCDQIHAIEVGCVVELVATNPNNLRDDDDALVVHCWMMMMMMLIRPNLLVQGAVHGDK